MDVPREVRRSKEEGGGHRQRRATIGGNSQGGREETRGMMGEAEIGSSAGSPTPSKGKARLGREMGHRRLVWRGASGKKRGLGLDLLAEGSTVQVNSLTA